MLLGQGYVPVISPIALGDDGAALRRRARRRGRRARGRARRPKLILLADAAGHHSSTASWSPICTPPTSSAARAPTAAGHRARRDDARAAGGVGRVHVIDGRTPHNLIAELFTDRGVGTLVTPMTATDDAERAAPRSAR